MSIVPVIVTIDEKPRPFDETVADLRVHGLDKIVELRLLGIATGEVDEESIPDLEALAGVFSVEIDETLKGAAD
jgi:hypothetical protein